MEVTLVWKPPTCADGRCESPSPAWQPPPPGTHIFGPRRDPARWEPVGITVDEDTLPHILTFTSCAFQRSCERDELIG